MQSIFVFIFIKYFYFSSGIVLDALPDLLLTARPFPPPISSSHPLLTVYANTFYDMRRATRTTTRAMLADLIAPSTSRHSTRRRQHSRTYVDPINVSTNTPSPLQALSNLQMVHPRLGA